MNAKELLEKRNLLKKKKPAFAKQDSHKKSKLSSSWRKPRGSDSKMRVSRKGYRRIVKIGWGSPSAVKCTDSKGLLPVEVSTIKDLTLVDPQKNVMVIPRGVGIKKRMVLVEQAISKKITISNYKEPEKFLTETKSLFEAKKQEKEKTKAEREKKKEAAKKEAEKKKAKEDKSDKDKKDKKDKTDDLAEEEKKIEEKKEKDKLLISTQQ